MATTTILAVTIVLLLSTTFLLATVDIEVVKKRSWQVPGHGKAARGCPACRVGSLSTLAVERVVRFLGLLAIFFLLVVVLGVSWRVLRV